MLKKVIVCVVAFACLSISAAYAAGESHVEFDSCGAFGSKEIVTRNWMDTDPRSYAIKHVLIQFDEWQKKWDGLHDVINHTLAVTKVAEGQYCATLSVMFRLNKNWPK